MTREEAIEILICEAVCDRPILSCDFCARYVGMGTDCDEPTDKEVEEAVLLLKGASKDLAISALRQQEHFRDITKKVEPLTNAQRIRSMSDEELAEFLTCINPTNCQDCAFSHGWRCQPDRYDYSSFEKCKEGRKRWLQQPVEEDDHD